MSKKIEKKYGLIFFLLSPILTYITIELLNQSSIILQIRRMLLNFIFIYSSLFIFFAITGKFKISIIANNIFLFLLSLINYIVVIYRGTPLVPWDIFSIGIATRLVSSFNISFNLNLLYSCLVLTFTIFLTTKFNYEILNFKYRRMFRGFSITSSILFLFLFFSTSLINIFAVDEHLWQPIEEYRNNGFLVSFMKQSKNLIIKPPAGYSKILLSNMYDSILTSNEIIDDNTNIEISVLNENNLELKNSPNIIVIINESFSDLSVIDDFQTTEDYIPFIRSLNKNTIKGNLHVSVFGGSTPNSEWEFLTGNSMAFMPYRSIPFQQYVSRKSESLVSTLEAQNYSSSALHSYYASGYRRNIVYPLYGFNEFLSIENLKDLNYIREYPDDLSTYQNIIELYENRNLDKNFFVYALTMQNHSGYDYEDFEPTITLTDYDEFPKVNQYLSLLKESDEALKYLVNYFSNQEEPTIILFFGDHQAWVEDEFYDELFSSYANLNDLETQEKKYITPFVIWANYDIEEKYIDNISLNYLSTLLLDTAKLKTTPYQNFLRTLSKKIPVITGNGYMDSNSKYHTFDEENEYSDLIKTYNYLQYNYMFDHSNKIKNLFNINSD